MNYLPRDLIKIIGYYLPYDSVPSYYLLFPNSHFLQTKLIETLQIPKDLIDQVWNRQVIELIPLQNYIKTLAYFGYVMPGSEEFLYLRDCFNAAVTKGNSQSIVYFGKLLGINREEIKDKYLQKAPSSQTFKVSILKRR